MSWFSDAIGNILTGGVTGILGSAITHYVTYKQKQLDYTHSEKILQLEIDNRREVAKIQADGAVAVAQEDSFTASLSADSATYSRGTKNTLLIVVDAIRGIIRPTITIYFAILSTWIFIKVDSKLLHVLTAQDFMRIYSDVIQIVLYIATSTVLWWFGTRPNPLPTSYGKK